MFVVVFQQVCTDLLQSFSKSLRFRGCRLATRSFCSLHRFLMGFRSGDLLGLNMLLFEPLLCCLGRMFWVIVMLEDPSTTHFQCSHWGKEDVTQNVPVHGPFILPSIQWSHPVPLSWETPPKHKVSTSMLHSGDGVLGVVLSISLPSNTASPVDAK